MTTTTYKPLATGQTPTYGTSGDSVKTLQTQLNAQNANTPGYVPLKVDGLYGPKTLEASQLKPTTTSTSSPQQQRDQAQNDFQTHYESVSKQITNIQNGTVPLTEGEQAQVDALKQQFEQLIDQQKLINTGASGLANVRGYQTGSAEYDPSFQVKTIGSIVTAGMNKVADLNIKMAGAVANLTQGFKDNDIKAIKDSWDMYQDSQKERMSYLQKTVDEANQAIRDAQDQANKDRSFNEGVREFNVIHGSTDSNSAFSSVKPTYKGEQLAMTEDTATELEKAGISSAAIIQVQKYLNQGYSLQQIAKITGMPTDQYNIISKYITSS